MKKPQETFVIVDAARGFDFLFASFSGEELEAKCAELNREANAEWRKEYEVAKKGTKIPYKEFKIFQVMTLDNALQEFAAYSVDECR